MVSSRSKNESILVMYDVFRVWWIAVCSLMSSDELVALDELGLGGDRHIGEVEYFAEKWFTSRPLHHLFLGEKEQAACEGDQEDQFEEVDPGGVQHDLHEGGLGAPCLILLLQRFFFWRVQDLIAVARTEHLFIGGFLEGRLAVEGLVFATDYSDALCGRSDGMGCGLGPEE